MELVRLVEAEKVDPCKGPALTTIPVVQETVKKSKDLVLRESFATPVGLIGQPVLQGWMPAEQEDSEFLPAAFTWKCSYSTNYLGLPLCVPIPQAILRHCGSQSLKSISSSAPGLSG